MRKANQRHQAPGRLEVVRRLLNTWEIPNDTRKPADRLPNLFDDSVGFSKLFGLEAPRSAEERACVVELRDDLRQHLAPRGMDSEFLDRWLPRLPVVPRLIQNSIQHQAVAPGVAGQVLAAVIDALASGHWGRLKACADCQYVFFDHSKNESRRWCMMTVEGPGGRSCGAIAKVRTYRSRQRQKQQSARA